MPPFIVIRGPRRLAGVRMAAAADAARSDGWTTLDGWAAPLARDRVVCTGWVRNADDARRALLAAVAGAGLIVAVTADPETLDRLVDELRRLGPVDHVAASARGAGGMEPEQRAVLGLLAEGLTVRDAAAELGIDHRVAARHIRAARQALGVETTAAAIAAALGREV